MPRVSEGVSNSEGFSVRGDVLTGRISLQEAFLRDAARIASKSRSTGPVADTARDPVLRFHLS